MQRIILKVSGEALSQNGTGISMEKVNAVASEIKELYELGLFLKEHPFWDAQIQQINVTAAKDLELVPRVGEHIIFIGKPGNYEKKFDRLKTFYKKGLNQVGWNKYSRISLEFENQIICTKKEK